MNGILDALSRDHLTAAKHLAGLSAFNDAATALGYPPTPWPANAEAKMDQLRDAMNKDADVVLRIVDAKDVNEAGTKLQKFVAFQHYDKRARSSLGLSDDVGRTCQGSTGRLPLPRALALQDWVPTTKGGIDTSAGDAEATPGHDYTAPASAVGHYRMYVSTCGDFGDKGKTGPAFNLTVSDDNGTDQITPDHCNWYRDVTTNGFQVLVVSGQMQGDGVILCYIEDLDTGDKLVAHYANTEYGIASCDKSVGSLG